MKIDVVLHENSNRFAVDFGEIQTAEEGSSKNAYDKGYNDGMKDTVAQLDSIIDRTITSIYSTASKISDHAFYTCKDLKTAVVPFANAVGSNGFRECHSLANVDVSSVVSLYGNSFRDCVSLTRVDLPNANRMFTSVFRGCSSLETLILRANTVCNASNVDVLSNTKIADGFGSIYVPDELIDAYRSDAVWKSYYEQIKPISELID